MNTHGFSGSRFSRPFVLTLMPATHNMDFAHHLPILWGALPLREKKEMHMAERLITIVSIIIQSIIKIDLIIRCSLFQVNKRFNFKRVVIVAEKRDLVIQKLR